MKPFKPVLQSVAQLRESAFNQARQRLAEATQAEGILGEQRSEVEAELVEMMLDRRERVHRPGGDPTALLASQRYEAALRTKLLSINEDTKKVLEEIARRQQIVAAARREVRVIELLNERAKERHKREQEKQEQRAMDEIASQRFMAQSALKLLID